MRDKTIGEMIKAAGWFKGSEREWQALSADEKKTIAFNGCGCEVAYPTWSGPVDCVHTGCQIRRGEKQPIVLTNRILQYEMSSGWLRFSKDGREERTRLARLIRAIRRVAIETGIYNPWEIPGGWQGIVGSAVS